MVQSERELKKWRVNDLQDISLDDGELEDIETVEIDDVIVNCRLRRDELNSVMTADVDGCVQRRVASFILSITSINTNHVTQHRPDFNYVITPLLPVLTPVLSPLVPVITPVLPVITPVLPVVTLVLPVLTCTPVLSPILPVHTLVLPVLTPVLPVLSPVLPVLMADVKQCEASGKSCHLSK